MAKKKSNKINPFILILICACLLYAMYSSLSTLVLGIWGQTTMGVVDSYDNRRDDAKAEINRSRTISKSYHFTVDGKEYKGYVVYLSDEAWSALKEGEVRTERISYFAGFPYINKPAMLTNFDQIGTGGLIYYLLSLPGCVFLLLLVTGRLGKKKKAAKKAAGKAAASPKNSLRRDNDMFCQSCGTKLPENAVFCINCGTSAHAGKAQGTKGTTPAAASRQQYTPPPNLIGFSNRCDDPEILEAARKNKKSSMGCAWFFALLFPLGFLLAGLFIDEMPLNEAIIIGVGLGVLMLVINLVRVKGMKCPVWEGVVTQKHKKERRQHNRDNDPTTYTEYTTVIKIDTGKEKRIIEKDSGRDMYDYLSVGDRVRYHPAFETYEKYDKSKDKIIYCNVCRMMNPVANDRCKRCDNLLFK